MEDKIETAITATGAGGFHEIREGAANILITEEAATFYNPIQEFNRDLTITVLSVFSESREAQKCEQMDQDGGGKPRLQDKRQQSGGGLRILDALSASGLRAMRFAREVPNVDSVLANDFSEQAFETIKRNVQRNQLETQVKPVYSDAIDLMMEHRKFEKRFHAIDLDPYGSAAIFLDSAVQAVVDGGLLMVTCTDTAILCGNAPEACFSKYGSVPLRHKSCHEIALRILLRAIDSHANRHGRYIIPLLSVSIDFYIRCFVRMESGAAAAKNSVTKLANLRCCAACQSLEFQPLVRKTVNSENNSIRFSSAHFQSNLVLSKRQHPKPTTSEIADAQKNSDLDDGKKDKTKERRSHSHQQLEAKCVFCSGTAIHTGGPIFVAPIHQPDFVRRILDRLQGTPTEQRLGTHERLLGVLTLIIEELPEQPLFYDHQHMMSFVKFPFLKISAIHSALVKAGFRSSGSHCSEMALKTDASMECIRQIYQALSRKGLSENNSVPPQPLHTKQTTSDAATKTSAHSLVDGPMPKTPEHYWDTGFPSPGEQLRRGYLSVTNSPLFKKKQRAKRRIFRN